MNQQLIRFKYEANLLYTQGILSQNGISFQTDETDPLSLLVKPEDHQKAAALVQGLNLDESEVNEENDGYIAGYEEWADKRFVNGYFTGGKIPLWMFDKRYARWFGPVNIISGLFLLYMISSADFSLSGALVQLFLCLVYIVCGILLTIRGFSK